MPQQTTPSKAQAHSQAATQAPAWYAIRQRTPVASAAMGTQAAAEILIYGDIGQSWWEDTVSAAQFVKDIAAVDATAITVRINSIGGSVPDGIAIYNAIKRHSATVTTVVDGMALSIASLIAMAGDTVEIAENAVFMVHAPWTWTDGNAVKLREQADMLDTWAAAMSTSYAAKTGKPQADMLALLTDGDDHWYTAAEAVAMGFADVVVSAAPVAAQASAAFDASRFLAKRPGTTAPAAQSSFAAAAAQTPVAQATQSPPGATMPQSVNPTAAAHPQPATPDEAAIRASAVAAESQRRADIRAAFQPFAAREGMAELATQLENDTAVTVQAAHQRILAKLGENTTPVAGGRVITTEDEVDKRRTAMASALLLRAGVASAAERAEAGANPFRGRTLLAMAEASLQAAGINTARMGDRREIVASAFTQSGSDFPVLLENVMHKTLLSAYGVQALTWSRFCKRGTVSDFRAHGRYRVGSLGNLQAKNELGEYKQIAIPDGEKSSITAATKGFILSISREAVINDDLGALTDQASAMGRAAARTVEADVYALLLSNSGLGPVMNDGKTLIHADHGNVATGAAMSVDAFDAMRVLMAQQRDVSGNDFLDLRPDVLLCPIGLGGTAKVINGAEFDTSVSNKFQVPNKVRGLFRDIVDSPRLSGTAYWALANVNEAAALEVAFLDGNSEPFMELETAFTTDGARYKVRLDYGVAGHDWRGAVRNAGA
ncbi:MAG: ClpP-like prohead protease/major capsid protein fusion protein [Burkholderiaceae bacterium]